MAKAIKKEKISGSVAVSPSSDDSWKHEDDFRTLTNAEDIKKDPERMKHAMKHGKGKMKSIKSVMDLVNYKNAKYGPGAEEEGESDGSQ